MGEQRPGQGRSSIVKILIALSLVILWGGMVFGGYYFARQYVELSIRNVQKTNATSVETLGGRLDTMSAQLKDIENTLRGAGLTLSSSDSTQKELNKKIENLDRQLQELERSLKTLKEAPNAAR